MRFCWNRRNRRADLERLPYCSNCSLYFCLSSLINYYMDQSLFQVTPLEDRKKSQYRRVKAGDNSVQGGGKDCFSASRRKFKKRICKWKKADYWRFWTYLSPFLGFAAVRKQRQWTDLIFLDFDSFCINYVFWALSWLHRELSEFFQVVPLLSCFFCFFYEKWGKLSWDDLCDWVWFKNIES